jgi:hypothetical protein
MDILKKYVDEFNRLDDECYKNDIDNSRAYDWLKEAVPIFECPNEDIERTYYFRFWTYRKHVKSTPEGYVITEFLPKVKWSGKYNEINAALGHHIYEGRWLRNSKKYLVDYIKYMLEYPEESHRYSTWLADAALKLTEVAGECDFGDGFLDKLCAYYEMWERDHGIGDMFWSVDDRDAMEYSISGTGRSLVARPGIRPTLNSYMAAEARAISAFAEKLGKNEISKKYKEKFEQLTALINKNLWCDGFYRARHYNEGEKYEAIISGACDSPREEIGYIPWMFKLPPKGREGVFNLLSDEKYFYSDYGITTAERCAEDYLFFVGRSCIWNGYVWPFATSQTLTALYNVINSYGCHEYKPLFYKLLLQYAKSHNRVRDDGTVVPWIDEVRHPERDEWFSRNVLQSLGWLERKGGYERGKDYNHSTFCDLVISGLVGVSVDGEELRVNPSIPESWDWFKLDGISFRGEQYSIIYDKYGTKYGMGKGLVISKKFR